MTGAHPDLTDPSTIPADLDDADLAVELTRRAAVLAGRMRQAGVSSIRKTSISDIVTQADHAAEDLITAALQRWRPADGIVGEEGSSRPSTSGRTWVIDPVDGTYNFHTGLTWWCSALALRAEPTDPTTGAPSALVLGAIHHVASGDSWVGGPNLPTRRNGAEVAQIDDAPLQESVLATYLHPTRLQDPAFAQPWLAMAGQAATLRMLGSASCDLAAVADGVLGIWAQHSLPEWDWLPGRALVLGAGGAAQEVTVNGHTWCVAGAPTAVAQAAARLRG
ncbi:inositol monophosphatase family protein, partial [Kribbia dieselivorans]|uniref:inositol monophosphatase family protein n=1 Tax=Kribbia dieselivorans TaxID=331526 RepID=UPI00083808DD